jgi:hypothetical protein
MRTKIDIEKSIEKKRLISTSWFVKFLDYFVYTFFIGALIICIIGPTVGIKTSIDSTKIIIIALHLVLLLIVFISLYKMDQLTLIDNNNLKLDKEYFLLLAAENEWTLIKEYDNVILFNANHWFFHERQVTIFIINRQIYLNVMSFGKNDIKSPLYFRKDKKILNRIKQKIINNAA